jgi:hypothetical protein
MALQIVRIDENHEAVAQIRITVVNNENASSRETEGSSEDSSTGNDEIQDIANLNLEDEASYVFGSPERRLINSHELFSIGLSKLELGDSGHHFRSANLDTKLRNHLRERGFEVDNTTTIMVSDA